ncbi:hypothetical protein [Cyclobacterium jeungdonense]|uniref:Uncharacterized protein n=1 Tax=Cyclobacterium jeungdonense TaxID=708087 RepID=A0ABT8C3U5_9BACT|nr:hypothetical protein [Cyclobacterium jeungdonense]MDN3687443.1 hypothetical protein [Cyclobacterium jeungdonense]
MIILLIILKYLGIVISGFFGAYGLITDFKDKQGKITNAGKRALVIILVSSAISIIAQTVEIYLNSAKEKAASEAALKELQQNSKILYNIDRTLNLIADVSVSYVITVDTTDTKIKSYHEKLASTVANLLDTISNDNHNELDRIGLFPSILSSNGRIEEITIDSKSDYFPDEFNEPIAYYSLGYSGINLTFFKKEIPIDSIINDTYYHYSKKDLEMNVEAGINSSFLNGPHFIRYNLNKNSLEINGTNLQSDSKYWNSSGKIIGIPDLLNTTLVISLRSSIVSGNDSIDNKVHEVRNQFQLRTLILEMSKGRDFRIKPEQTKRFVNKDGWTFYIFKFPSSIEELNKL